MDILFLLAFLGYLVLTPFLFGRLFGRVRELEWRLERLTLSGQALDALGARLKRVDERLARLEGAQGATGSPVVVPARPPGIAAAPAPVHEAVAPALAPAPVHPVAPPASVPAPATTIAAAGAVSAGVVRGSAARAPAAADIRVPAVLEPAPEAPSGMSPPAAVTVLGRMAVGRVQSVFADQAGGATDARPYMERLAPYLRAQLPRQEWEAVIGTSWLNKLGVLVLVIGISLFIGYSLTQLGPAGRVAIGFAAGALLLGGGVVVERRARYVIFGRGLIGGGWAALYFVTYAMHGLDAARVMAHPWLATILLVGVASAMIAHSLRYRAQTVTGLGYVIGFATLAIAPVSTFALVATVPLAATLVWVAYRFSWVAMAVVGLVTTYGVFAVTADPAPAAGVGLFAREQLILALYWLMFEAFDVLSERRGGRAQTARLLFPLNATAFLGVSLIRWTAVTPATVFVFLGVAAGAYLTSAVARVLLQRRGPADAAAGVGADLAGRGYRAPVTVAVALVVAGIFTRFDGMQVHLALLLVGQLVFLSGLRFNDVYLRWLAAAPFAILVSTLVLGDVLAGVRMPVGTFDVLVWTPMALLAAAVLYLNRALVSPRGPIDLEQAYRPAASALVALAAGLQAPAGYRGAVWLALALGFFEAGLRDRLREFRVHAYIVGAVGVAGAAVALLGSILPIQPSPWVHPALLIVLAYAWLARLELAGPEELEAGERRGVWQAASWGGTVSVTALLWTVIPTASVAIGWLVFAGVLFEIGLRARFTALRPQAYAVATLATATLFVQAFPAVVDPVRLLVGLGIGSVLYASAFLRLVARPPAALAAREHTVLREASSACATALVAILCWQLLPVPVVGLAWGAIGLLLLETGVAQRFAGLRTHGHVLMALMAGRIVLANLTVTGAAAGLSYRVLTVLPAIALLYYVSVWLRDVMADGRTGGDARVPRLYLHAGTALAVALLQFELGASAAVAGWAVMAAALLALGLRTGDTDLRAQGYLIALLAFVRAWTGTFEMPASLAGTPDRVATAAIVIGSFYVAQLLLTRAPAGSAAAPTGAGGLVGRIDGRARPAFSIMATLLLATFLFHEASPGLLTVAWSLQGVALLGIGFLARDRVLRRSGLVLLALCTVKAFAYDFRHLETLARIVSFIVLGLLMLATSWVYARYSDRLQRYL